LDEVDGRRMVEDAKEKRIESLCVEKDSQTAYSIKPPHDRIEMALVLIDEARILEKNSRGCDVPSLQQAAAKYLEAASNIKSFVVQLEKRGGCESASTSNSMKCLLENIKMYTMNAEVLNSQVRRLTSPPLEEALDLEEVTGARNSEPGLHPPTGGQVHDDDTSLEEPHQEMAAKKCREAVSYSKTHVKQHDRQRVSWESLNDIPDLESLADDALENELLAWCASPPLGLTQGDFEQPLEGGDLSAWSDLESNVIEPPETESLIAQDFANNHEGLDFAGYDEDEDGYEYPSDLESIFSDASFLPGRETIGGEPPQKMSNVPPPSGVTVMQDDSDLESYANEPPEIGPHLAQESTDDEPPQKKSRLTTELDYSQEMEPTEHDVLHGRGEHTNKHPGNINFRKKARELLPKYKECSNEEKYRMSVELMQSVTSKGHNFLGEEGGKWYRVLNPRKKASQAFRPPKNTNQARLDVRGPASPTSVAVGRQDIDPISIASEEYKNEDTFDHQSSEFLDETTLIDEPAYYQPNPLNCRRVIDLSRPIESYDDDDVLFGKGEKIKQHLGNIRLRQEAEKLFERYDSCSKQQKKIVAVELIDAVTMNGRHRFLDIGPGGKWYRVVGDAPRKKASQTFRDIRDARLSANNI
jgi:hypothetical protein